MLLYQARAGYTTLEGTADPVNGRRVDINGPLIHVPIGKFYVTARRHEMIELLRLVDTFTAPQFTILKSALEAYIEVLKDDYLDVIEHAGEPENEDLEIVKEYSGTRNLMTLLEQLQEEMGYG